MAATDIIAGIALICAIIAIVLDFVKGGAAGAAGAAGPTGPQGATGGAGVAGPTGPKGPIGTSGNINLTTLSPGSAQNLAGAWVNNTSYLNTLAGAVADQIPKNTAVAHALAKDLAQNTGVSLKEGSGQSPPFTCTYDTTKKNWGCTLNGSLSLASSNVTDVGGLSIAGRDPLLQGDGYYMYEANSAGASASGGRVGWHGTPCSGKTGCTNMLGTGQSYGSDGTYFMLKK